jgi:predicted PurR-regulated permease PerM
VVAGDEREPVTVRTVFRWSMAGALGVLAVVLGLFALYSMRGLLIQAFIAVFVAVSLDPAVRFLIRHGVKRGRAVALIVVFILALTAAVLWTVIPPLVTQVDELTSDLPTYLDRVREASPGLRRLESGLGLRLRIDQLSQDLPVRVAEQGLEFGRRFLRGLLSVLVVAVLTIYLMLDLARLCRGVVELFPRRHRARVSDVIGVVIDKVGAYMIGNLLISLIAGVATLIALTALRVPFALPLAVLVAIADLIPFVGATIGAVASLFVTAATTNLWPSTVLVAVFFVLYQQIENYVIVPRVLRDTVKIPAIAVLFAALVGASVLGIVGALIAIPVAATIRVIGSERMRARDEADAAAEERDNGQG